MGVSKLQTVLTLYLFSPAVLSIWIENNAYKSIYVFSSNGWSDQTLQKLKEVLTKSSEYLYHATRSRSYFGEFVLSDAWCNSRPSRAPDRVDIHVTDVGTTLRTQHSRGCGEAGEVMFMPLSWLQGETAELARQFVQQWSIYRYGVFEEDPIYDASCYRSKGSWYPVGCYDKEKGPETSPEFENGLPFCSIDLNDTSSFELTKSSLMFTSNISKAMDFCDGSPSFPHDPVMPTLHNNLCEGKNTWSVIENTQDFKFGKNRPLMQSRPPQYPAFTGFCPENLQLTFAIQNNTREENITDAVAGIGYSLYQYLSSMKERTSLLRTEVNIVTFSDKEDEPLQLDVAAENLKDSITDYVKSFRVVSRNCVSCGFRKASEVSKGKHSSIIVVFAWENTIGDEAPSEVLKIIRQSPDSQFNLVLVENTDADVLSANLINAIRSTGGQIFFLPNNLLRMASSLHAVLSTIIKNPLQIEDGEAVVHEAVYEKIAGSFTDSFATLNPDNGTLEYLIHCYPLNRIVPAMQKCVHTTSTIDIYKCVEELEPDKIQSWKFHHTDKGGIQPPYCSSVAILHNRLSTSKGRQTLRGWLSENAIEPGKDALIVYAEIIGPSGDHHVKAEISGPDDFVISIELRDNGNGDPDVKRGDGIFSRYFTVPSLKKGSYGVKIFAETKFEDTGKFYTDEPSRDFVRQSKSIGFFSVTKSFPQEDIFQPNRVGDLRAVSYDPDNGTVTLQWTAPGNDYDNGTATAYEIRYSNHPSSLSEHYFNSEENMEPLYKGEFTPSKSGTLEKTEIIISSTHDFTCYIALRAKDANKNKGKISNILQIYINAMQSSSTQASTELDSTTPVENITTENPETSTMTVRDESKSSFHRKFIITASTAAGVLLFVIICLIICWCWVKKCKPKKVSKKATLQPPYNLNIAYQNDSPEENDRDISVTTTGNPSINLNPQINNSPNYTYHTPKSLNNQGRLPDNSELGFRLVDTMPATRSLSRFKRRLNDSNSETDSEGKPVPAPQQPPNDAHVYSLGIV